MVHLNELRNNVMRLLNDDEANEANLGFSAYLVYVNNYY